MRKSGDFRWRRALVTGASSGIGECLARRLAVEKTALVLVARRQQRLEMLAAELRRTSEVDVEVLTADLTDPLELASVEARLASRDAPVDLLINNAGGMRLAVFPAGDEEKWIRLNVFAAVRLCAAAIPGMRERGRGTILNVSSGAAFHPHPYAAVYGATKAFLNSFSEAIREENRESGISVTVVCPGFTRTDLAEHSGFEISKIPRFLWMTPDAVAALTLAAAKKRKRVYVPGLLNKLDAAFGRYAPRSLLVRSVAASTRRFGRDFLK